MSSPAVVGASQRFDLTAAATMADRYTRYRRVLSTALTIFLVGFGIFGGVVLATDTKDSILAWVAPVIVADVGFGTAAFIWIFTPRKSPRAFVIDHAGFTLDNIPRSKPLRMQWDDPRLKVSVYDLRGLPQIGADGAQRPSDFALQFRPGSYAYITGEAYELLLGQARARGLDLARRQVGIAGASSPVLRLTIRAKPS